MQTVNKLMMLAIGVSDMPRAKAFGNGSNEIHVIDIRERVGFTENS